LAWIAGESTFSLFSAVPSKGQPFVFARESGELLDQLQRSRGYAAERPGGRLESRILTLRLIMRIRLSRRWRRIPPAPFVT